LSPLLICVIRGMADGSSKPWTNQEIERLRLLAAQGLGSKRIAAELKRSCNSIRSRVARECISLNPRRYLEWVSLSFRVGERLPSAALEG
jgi:orotate phosphoribosyltransferase-like protein